MSPEARPRCHFSKFSAEFDMQNLGPGVAGRGLSEQEAYPALEQQSQEKMLQLKEPTRMIILERFRETERRAVGVVRAR